MSPYAVRVDCFTTLDALKARDQKNDEAVLDVLRRVGRFSVFDPQPALMTVMRLHRAGRIRYTDKLGYPWTSVEVIDPLRASRETP